MAGKNGDGHRVFFKNTQTTSMPIKLGVARTAQNMSEGVLQKWDILQKAVLQNFPKNGTCQVSNQ